MGSGVWQAGQMDGYRYWVSGLELQKPKSVPCLGQSPGIRSHPGPRKTRGPVRGRGAGVGHRQVPALTLSAPSRAPQTSCNPFTGPHPSLPPGQWGRGTLSPCTPGSFHLIPSCSQHPTMPWQPCWGLTGPSSPDLPALGGPQGGGRRLGCRGEQGTGQAVQGQGSPQAPLGCMADMLAGARSVSHQPHQTRCLLLARPFSWALWSRGPGTGTSEGQGSPWRGEADDACKCLAVPARLGQPVGSQG